MHQLIASPFLGQYLLLRPGNAKGVAIPESRFADYYPGSSGSAPTPPSQNVRSTGRMA